MNSIPTFRPLTNALLGLLEAASPRPVGDGRAPGSTTAQAPIPYGILRRLTPTDPRGDVASPGSMLTVTYEVTVVGTQVDQVELLGDVYHAAILNRTATGFVNPLVVAGLNVMDRSAGEMPEPQFEGAVVNDKRRYRLYVSVV